MSRGRQKRVEKNAQRRLESKKKKAQKEIRSTYKTLVQNQLFPLLDKVNAVLFAKSRVGKLHVWVDTLPCSRQSNDNVQEDDYDADDSLKKNKKQKSKGAGVKSPTAKKAHPRSSEASEAATDLEDEPLLCRDFFFHGECQRMKSGKSKKSGSSCRHNHYPSKHITLATALKEKPDNGRISENEYSCVEVLKLTSRAAAVSQMNSDETVGQDPDKVDGIDMLHHVEILLSPTTLVEGLNVSSLVSKTLASEKVPISGIAFVTYSNVLIFDRFRGGAVLDEETESKLFEVVEADGIDLKPPASNNEKTDYIVALSATILEHILSYLPDRYSGNFPTLCKAFYAEIGRSTPGLWKHLLQRHNWPVIHDIDSDEPIDPIVQYKDSFIRHILVSQRVRSLTSGIDAVLNYRRDCLDLNTVVAMFGTETQDFDQLRHVIFWDDTSNSVLVASRYDCILYLYNILKQNSMRVCKQTLEVRVAPISMSRKSECSLHSIVTDDRYLVCSYGVESQGWVLASMVKENLLTNSMEGSILSGEVLRCHNVRERFLDFLDLSLHNPRFDYLRHIFQDNEEEGSAYGRPSIEQHSDVHACGHGIFLVLISVNRLAYYDMEVEYVLTGLMTFSASTGKDFIIDFQCFLEPIKLTERVIIDTNYHRKKSIEPTQVVCRNISSLTEIFVVKVERNGTFQEGSKIIQSLDYETSMHSISEGNQFSMEASNMLAECVDGRTRTVASYLLTSNDGVSRNRVAITVELRDWPSGSNECTTNLTTIFLPHKYSEIMSLQFLDNEEYFVILCTNQNDEDLADHKDFVDHYLFEDPYPGRELDPYADSILDLIIIHTASLTKIHCSRIKNSRIYNEQRNDAFPAKLDVTKTGAIAAALGSFGLCIAGGEAVDVEDGKKIKEKKVKRKKRMGNVGKDRGLLKL